ncbi:hypothetical protein EON63_24435, partial [archaeon]
HLPYPFPPPAALRVCGQVASALGHMHLYGMAHRDVKPQNIMLTSTDPLLGTGMDMEMGIGIGMGIGVDLNVYGFYIVCRAICLSATMHTLVTFRIFLWYLLVPPLRCFVWGRTDSV